MKDSYKSRRRQGSSKWGCLCQDDTCYDIVKHISAQCLNEKQMEQKEIQERKTSGSTTEPHASFVTVYSAETKGTDVENLAEMWAVYLSPSFSHSHSLSLQCLLNFLWPPAESYLLFLFASSDSLGQVQRELRDETILSKGALHNLAKQRIFSTETKQRFL